MESLLNVLLFHVAGGSLKATCLQWGQGPGVSLSRSCGVGSHAEGQAGPGHLLPIRSSNVGSGQAQPVRRLGGGAFTLDSSVFRLSRQPTHFSTSSI